MSAPLPASKVLRQTCIDQAALDSRDALLRMRELLERMDQRFSHLDDWLRQLESEIKRDEKNHELT